MRFLDSPSPAVAERRHDEDLQATLEVWNDALRQVIADTATLQTFKALLDRTAGDGYGQNDIAAVFETLIAENRRTRPIH